MHDEPELERALAAGAELVGINNRDLRSFKTDLGVTRALAAASPPAATVVAESGLDSPDVLRALEAAGARGVPGRRGADARAAIPAPRCAALRGAS